MQVVFNLQYVLFSISNLSVCCDAVAMFFTIATSHLISSHKTRAVTELRPHSIILASCKPGCKPGFRPDLQPCFRQVHAGLRHAFDQLSTFLVENLVANRSRFGGLCAY